MKRIWSFIPVFLVIVFLHANVLAEPTKIAVVDLQRFQKTSKAYQKIGAEIQGKFQEMQKKLDQEKEAVKELENELKKQSMMLSLDAQEDKKRALEKKQRYYKYLYEDFTQEMKALEVEAIKKIMKELEKIVEKIGKNEGYTLILERRTLGLMYYEPSADITERVIEAYDKLKQQ